MWISRLFESEINTYSLSFLFVKQCQISVYASQLLVFFFFVEISHILYILVICCDHQLIYAYFCY